MRKIETIVENLIIKYNTRDPFKIAEELGIWIYEMDLGNTQGHYIYAKRKRVFFINTRLTNKARLLCCAHELGHAILHTKNNIYFNNSHTFFNQSKHEIEADKFAALLVLEDDMLEEYEGFTMETIAKCENIDVKYLNKKFKN